ncbi:hypothetical protein [Novosphingobium mangrovi (ex Huang et al. 2023)]|uniref:VOC domain-containing protein n=1 Tax=Novosphingobium mangrovi (ex Huang et al. 2023) TaxID=2976432 RepID=A0ABT2IA41_9SPHN|nr:hypothetical protein [Novosphingobium mangrovi (ex Huang et al. 2023)]MCT2401695.1 hypothetical protein [Novosphingobium mangrovi (ex Huang et al. 2023)]
MIFHVSIDARDPQHVATVLAELLGGRATPFPPVAEGSWVAHADDDRNTLVEVYPRGTQLVEAPGDADFLGVPGEGGLCASHFAMATRLSQADVFAIAAREGWPAKYRKRGGAFGVIELWIEGDRVVEVLTDVMQAEYLATMRLSAWEDMLAHGDERHRVTA